MKTLFKTALCIAYLLQIIGYYSITGQSLPQEPENGVYIIKYDKR